MAVDVARMPSLLPVLAEGKPDAKGWLQRRLTMAGVVVFLVLLPLLLDPTRASYMSRAIIFIIIGLSVNALIGYAGQVSLGHDAFVGTGAFTSALLVSNGTMPFFIAILVAAATGAVAAIALGFVALRLKGLYLALITLAYGTLATSTIFALPSVTGGGAGVPAPRPALFTTNKEFVYLCGIFLVLIWLIDWRLTSSKVGRAIFAIRENEIAAASFGINVMSYKLIAFVYSGAVAGIAGALFAANAEFVTSNDFGFLLALTWVLMVAVGGLGSRPGVAIGSAFFAVFPFIGPDIPGLKIILKDPHSTPAVGALLLIVTLTMNPGGIAQQIRPITEWVAGKKFSLHGHKESGISAGGAGVRP